MIRTFETDIALPLNFVNCIFRILIKSVGNSRVAEPSWNVEGTPVDIDDCM